MICEYCQVGDYFGFCMCSKTNEICPFMRRCSLERKWLPLESMNRCILQKEEKSMAELKQGEYPVLFESKGLLYVEYNDNVFKFANPFDEVPKSVELVRVENELYIKGYEPKVEPKVEKKEEVKGKKKKDK